MQSHKGSINSVSSQRGIVYDPNDIAKTTLKQTTIDSQRYGNIQNTQVSDGPGGSKRPVFEDRLCGSGQKCNMEAQETRRQSTSDIEKDAKNS